MFYISFGFYEYGALMWGPLQKRWTADQQHLFLSFRTADKKPDYDMKPHWSFLFLVENPLKDVEEQTGDTNASRANHTRW